MRLKDEFWFPFFVEQFKKMISEGDLDVLREVGGVRELAKALGVDVDYGIDETEEGQKDFSMEERKEVWGQNLVQTHKPRAPFPMTHALIKSRLLIPLLVAAMVTTILGLSFEQERENLTWIGSIACWIASGITVSTSVALDFQLFWTRGEMKREKEVFDVTVIRNGKEQLIKNVDLLVGDVLVLTKDVTIAADGVLFANNNLVIDEQIFTGESKRTKKTLVEDPFCKSGTQVSSGSGRMLVAAVGENSELGQAMKMVTYSTDYAIRFGYTLRRFFFLSFKPSLCLGIISFIVLLIWWMACKKGFPLDQIDEEGPVHSLILAIVIMVVELPKGYFLCIFFLFVYLMRKLARDKVYVGNPNAFATMSSVTSICFDRRTLTENRMTVVKGWFQGMYFDREPKLEELDPSAVELIAENASLNSEAFFNIDKNRSIQLFGNQTEYALLIMTENLGVDYSEVRLNKRQLIIKNYGFNSDKKMSSVIIKHGDLLRLYNKGASEMVLNECTEYVDRSGFLESISEVKRYQLENVIETMAHEGLRTLALTYADLDPNDFNFGEDGEPLEESIGGKRGFEEAPEENLVLLAIVGIRDPVREGVAEVVDQFKNAGIVVRMITGDNISTAKRVARECGILTSGGLTIEGPEFRQRAEQDVEGLKRDLPKLQVMARSSPSDKEKLVKLLDSLNEKVAVSGDDTNVARALKESNIGIAMGKKSTEVAREAADVTILNNRISSILTFYLWSRRLVLSFLGFFQFRMSVTLVVWIVVLVSVCVGGETPLSVHQFLWASLIIDTLIVLTFATEKPPAKVPDDGSYQARRDPLKKRSYFAHVGLQSLYHIICIICTFYSLSSLFERYDVPAKDEFYYHYCTENPYWDSRYGDSPVGSLCDQYLDCDYFTKECTLLEEQRVDELGLDHDFRDHIIGEYEREHDAAKMRKTSLIFNMFIFMQLFNSLNCRRVLNEYNIFERLFNSRLSCAIRITTIVLHVLLMVTPLRDLFKLSELNGWEWLYSMAVSIGVLAVGTLTRYIMKARQER